MDIKNTNHRVVVSGMGALTSLGPGVQNNWDSILKGMSGVREIQQFDSTSFPVHIGSEVNLDTVQWQGMNGINMHYSRSALFGIWAMEEAWKDSQLSHATLDKQRCGVCLGASTFPVVDETLNMANPRKLLEGELFNEKNTKYYLELCHEYPELLTQRNFSSISALLSARHDLRGVSVTVQSACTSATHAIGEAYHMIKDGSADVIFSGGADSMMSLITVTGFTLLGALSTHSGDPCKASRPFDSKRDGFVIGEGSGIIVLEELEHALNRNAPIYAEVIGYGSSSDGYRFTDMPLDGIGAVKCMNMALNDANIAPTDVGYINAHGTSTFQNDRVETTAIKTVFGEYAYNLPVSSTKSSLGHMICASGGIEMIFTINALKDSILPPTINYENPDPACDLDYVPNNPRKSEIDIAMSNSFGFGGQNGTLIVKRWAAE